MELESFVAPRASRAVAGETPAVPVVEAQS